jgi:hypothetical protein
MERMGDEEDPAAAAMFTGPLSVDLPLLAIFSFPLTSSDDSYYVQGKRIDYTRQVGEVR